VVPALLYLLVFALMPFSVVGLKGRLDVIDTRLDEIHGEVRMLSLRLADPASGSDDHLRNSSSVARTELQPPVPPVVNFDLHRSPPSPRPYDRPAHGEPTGRPNRAEPRLNWPR
jgi:hypothetical protein